MTILYYFFAMVLLYWGIRCLLYAWQIRYLSQTVSPTDCDAKVSILVPFCNEGETIVEVAKKLGSLKYTNIEVIYINDRSTDDGPKALANYLKTKTNAFSERILQIKNLPSGWLGKVHALHKGIHETTGDWVLLIDGDVMLEPDALSKAVSHASKNELDHLAVVAEFGSQSFWTASLQAAFFSVVPLLFLPEQVRSAKSSVYAGVGAFQLVRRSFFERVGGMRWLALEVIDDIGLGKLVKASSGKSELVSGLGLVRLNWYASIQGMIRGTEKNVFAGSRYSLTRILSNVGVLALLFGACIWTLLGSPPSIFTLFVVGAAIIVFLVGLHCYYKVWNFNILHTSVFFLMLPILFWMVLRNSVLAWKQGGISWRGSFYPLDLLSANQRVFLVADYLFGYPKLSDDQANKDQKALGAI